MKKLFKTLIAFFAFLLFTQNSFSQAPVRDRWDTLYANVDYLNTTNILYQMANMPVGNNLVILSDSINTSTTASYLQYFNSTNNSLTNINYTRLFHDMGTYGGAAYTTTTANLSYVFFGPKTYSFGVSDFGFYKYNTLTNAVTTETVSLASYDNNGIANMGFYSPTTNHDSLIIFVRATLVSNDSIYIYKKHYNQAGVINSNVKLPVQLQYITKTFIFNNTLYVAGYTNANDGRLLKSNDGLTYTVITNFESSYPLNSVVDMDTLNNKLYLGLKPTDGNTGYTIIETADGNNFATITSNSNNWALSSLKKFKKTIWFSFFENYANKHDNNNSNIMWYNFMAPHVGYIEFPNSEVLSIDTLGRLLNQGETFKLQRVNNKLLLSGNYFDDANSDKPGNFIYQFIPPVSNFTISTPNICLNTPQTFVSQSSAADSVRWFVDNNFSASTSTAFANSFSSVGSHTIGLIAISGTQKDTLKYTVNVYSVTITNVNSFNSCIHNTTTIIPSTPGAMSPISYTWSVSSGLNSSSTSGSTINLSANASGGYTYNLVVSDVNNCSAYSALGNITIGTNKDITGVVTVTSTPLNAGNVTLYKYEPILTRFDSITTQPLNAAGEFTFAGQDAFTYILKCEPTALSLENTYAPSETSWKTAAQVVHGCVTNTAQNISVVPLTNIGTGPGILSGKITEGIGFQSRGGTFSPGQPIGGLSIKGGRNPGGNIVAQGKSNSAGEYTLSNMPISGNGETYFILVDVPGLDTNTTYHVAITTSSLQYNDLNFIVDSAKINPTMIMGIRNFKLNNSSIKVFPNPTNGLINVVVDLHSPEQITIKLIDITGREVKSVLSTTTFNDTLKLKTDIGNLPEGVYFLKVKIGDAEQAIKIIITN